VTLFEKKKEYDEWDSKRPRIPEFDSSRFNMIVRLDRNDVCLTKKPIMVGGDSNHMYIPLEDLAQIYDYLKEIMESK
jgi:hypothetical protein